MESTTYFAVIGEKSITSASPREIAEAVLRARMSGAEAVYLVRGANEQQEAEGKELIEAWLRQLSKNAAAETKLAGKRPSGPVRGN